MSSEHSLSLVVVAHNMARELPRTLRSLSSQMQRGAESLKLELLVVDHGSVPPLDPALVTRDHPGARLLRVDAAPSSPVSAINAAVAKTSHSLVGVWIDGARIASPGLLRGAVDAAALSPSPVIGSLNFHLGPDIQRRSVPRGYDQAEEDRLLASVAWQHNGYRLFSISTLGGSSSDGWFCPVAETGSLFLRRRHWQRLGGYDERFRQPGGGLANLDLWTRAIASPGATPIMLLGEGTFHQLHGGAMTNSVSPMFERFDDEYAALRGERYRRPDYQPMLLGRVPPEAAEVLAWSAERAVVRTRAQG